MNREAHELRVECSRLAAKNSETALEAVQKALDLFLEQVGIATQSTDAARRQMRIQAQGLRQQTATEKLTKLFPAQYGTSSRKRMARHPKRD